MSESRPATNAPQVQLPSGSAPGWDLFTPFLCITGLCFSTYLSVMHFGLLMGDVSLGGVCGAEGDCNSVVSSRYGSLLGLPVSVWGMGYYILAATLASAALLLRREDSAAFVRATLWLTLTALVFDAYLAWAMVVRLERFCPLCAATYAVNVLILLVTVRAARAVHDMPGGMRSLLPSWSGLLRPAEPMYYREVFKLFLTGLGAGASAVVLVLSLIFSHSIRQSQNDELAGLLEYLRRVTPFAIATEGLPSRGPERAPISIVVFSDFECEQCKRANKFFEIVAANHRDSLRMTYVSYPADRACNPNTDKTLHPGACVLARAAACARRQGRFWEFHDAVFGDPGKVGAEKAALYAAHAGLDTTALNACLTQGDSANGLAAGVALARSLGVVATPTSFINGRPVVGALKPWMLEAALVDIMRSPAADSAHAGLH